FFQGLSYPEIGARLGLTENAARMRTERALDTLRRYLEGKGLVSSSAALGLLMANQVVGAVPAGLAATVTSAALTVTPSATAGIAT
ncbi:RNA polymerase sigma factor, partial [Streptococcus pyogenes]